MSLPSADVNTLPRVAALFVHPIKSAGSIAVNDLELDARGATGDRRWMLVNDDGVCITARTHAALALVQPSFATTDRNGALVLSVAGHSSLRVNVPHAAASRTVMVWTDAVPSLDAGDDAAEWCSDAIREHTRLVYLAPEATRPVKAKYAGPLDSHGREVMLSDGAPLLLLARASLDALNARLLGQGGKAMSVARFRPNILLDAVAAHAEDTWREIEINGVRIGLGTPCVRCVMTTIDPLSGDRGTEPLRTLATYRRDDSGVVFGVNAMHSAPGRIRVGDAVTVKCVKES